MKKLLQMMKQVKMIKLPLLKCTEMSDLVTLGICPIKSFDLALQLLKMMTPGKMINLLLLRLLRVRTKVTMLLIRKYLRWIEENLEKDKHLKNVTVDEAK